MWLKLKILLGYVILLLLLVLTIHIFRKEQTRRNSLRQDEHELACIRHLAGETYAGLLGLATYGETASVWDESDLGLYHTKKDSVCNMLQTLKRYVKSPEQQSRIDSLCLLLERKELLLDTVMDTFERLRKTGKIVNRRIPAIVSRIRQADVLDGKLPPHIDTAYAPYGYFPVNGFDFSPHRHVAPSALPEGFTEGLTPLYSHPLRPDAESFGSFISRFKDDGRTRTTVSRENYDIYRLLTVARNGYMNVHEKPFTYFDTLLPVARKLEQVTQVKTAAAFNADDFRIYSSVISRQAEAILQRDFDVRGHRSIVNELDDGDLTFTVGRVKLNPVQRAVLADGHAVHLPENDSPENRHRLYCMADKFENRLVTSARPFFGVRTYRMTDDGLIRPVEPEPDGKARKREMKSKSNKPKI